jgi:hypothetical protein
VARMALDVLEQERRTLFQADQIGDVSGFEIGADLAVMRFNSPIASAFSSQRSRSLELAPCSLLLRTSAVRGACS